MEQQQKCTLTDICIAFLVKNYFRLSIEPAGNGCLHQWDWAAKRADLCLYAIDPVELVALYIISDDWISNIKIPESIWQLL